MTAESSTRVSVLIPAFNAQATIQEAVESVLAQTFTDFEIVVVDDGSQDATPTIVARLADHDARIRLIRMPHNRGRPAARNTAQAAARGEYLAMLDADDRCVAHRLARQVAFLERHPSVDVVGSWWQGMDGAGRTRPVKRNQRVLSPAAVDCFLLFRGIIHNPTVMARHRALDGFAYDSAFPVAQDYDLWARMLLSGHHFAQIPEVLVHYRHHPSQASTARADESRERRCLIQARLLAALGVACNDDDVRRHNLLYTGRKLYEQHMGLPMDRAFVAWARGWFDNLLRANAQSRFYPEPAFSDLVGMLWLNVCRKASVDAGRLASWRAFARSQAGRHHIRRVARLRAPA